MFSKSLSLVCAIAGLAVSAFGAKPLTINTPAVAQQCVPTNITWNGGSGLFFLLGPCSLLNDGHPLQEFGGLPADQRFFVWETNIPAGIIVNFNIADENGDSADSAPFVIQPGPSNCTLLQLSQT
ncbi:hypothetical protein BD413DRAFT_613369 [Trametes elegans]|nr:hypothetical protein BD413DRAFT_613369 [Trametes elegans]